jgi:hypothetical protein
MPTPPPPSAPAVDRILAEMPAPLRAIARALRAQIRAAAPELTETVKWGAPCYVGQHEVVYFAAYAAHVNLGFYRGAHLDDASGRLEGTGKGLRHVKLRSVRETTAPEIRRLIRAAVRVDAP